MLSDLRLADVLNDHGLDLRVLSDGTDQLYAGVVLEGDGEQALPCVDRGARRSGGSKSSVDGSLPLIKQAFKNCKLTFDVQRDLIL